MRSLYLHIPFCSRKCPYCSFSSVTNQERLYGRYCRALSQEIAEAVHRHGAVTLDTLFIGGGTPTVLDDNLLDGLLSACLDSYTVKSTAEVTLESNPETLLLRDLNRLQGRLVNRLSVGIQSLNDRELRLLGRAHDSSTAKKAVLQARQAGIKNLSLDLMYGLPGQTSQAWLETLRQALDLYPDHLSIYQLTLEPETDFAKRALAGDLLLPEEDLILEMDELTQQWCCAAGLEQYEISNFARPGYECRHNLVYWRNETYLGCGAAAVSYSDGKRCARTVDPETYCRAMERGGTPIVNVEQLDDNASFRETVVMGLRLIEGVSVQRLKHRFNLTLHEIYGDVIDRLVGEGWLDQNDQVIRLTSRGRPVANVIMAELV